MAIQTPQSPEGTLSARLPFLARRWRSFKGVHLRSKVRQAVSANRRTRLDLRLHLRFQKGSRRKRSRSRGQCVQARYRLPKTQLSRRWVAAETLPFYAKAKTDGFAFLETKTKLVILQCALTNWGCSGLWTSLPGNLHRRSTRPAFAICYAGLHNTATTRRSTGPAQPFRLGLIGWCFGRSMQNTAAFQQQFETQAPGLCSPKPRMRIFTSAGHRGMATSTRAETRRDGACSTSSPNQLSGK